MQRFPLKYSHLCGKSRLVTTPKSMRDSFVKIVDEASEYRLYAESYFVVIDIPSKAREALSVEVAIAGAECGIVSGVSMCRVLRLRTTRAVRCAA